MRVSLLFSSFSLLASVTLVVSTTLFEVGKEFKYRYETLVTAGSEQPISYASAYKLRGTLVVSAQTSTTLFVKLDELTVGLYNGKWSYFPIPEMTYISLPNLAPLAQPFQITVENGKVKSILLDDQEPEWASNMKRGLATYLQLDLQSVNFTQIRIFSTKELTTIGECGTRYEVLPSSTTLNRLTRVNKFRNHAHCPDVPSRTRYATHIFYPCKDEYTRDIMNSTAYSTYEMDLDSNGQPVLKQLTLFSSVLYWPFTASGPYQFTWVNMTLSLESVSALDPTTALTGPSNPETHEDLTYVFEQSDPSVDPEDETQELTNEVLFFHHLTVDDDPETYQKTVQMIKSLVQDTAQSLVTTDSFFKDWTRFHTNSPSSIMFLVASLDYANLKELYAYYAARAKSPSSTEMTERDLFLDGLILSGTTPSTLVIRDALLTSTDATVLSRLSTALPHFIRNPTEALAKEMDSLLSLLVNNEMSVSIRRSVTFSLASLIGRGCRKTLCTTSGLLDKYVEYFQKYLEGEEHNTFYMDEVDVGSVWQQCYGLSATDFEQRAVGVLALRNLRYGNALNKVVEIACGKVKAETSLRIQAVWSLRPLYYTDGPTLMANIMPVFFNRSEPCELRSTLVSFVVSLGPDPKVLHDLAYFMWTETCPDVPNILRSHLVNAMNSKSPCGNEMKSYARTILQYLPPGDIDPLKSTAYRIDYYDIENGFGHQIYSTVHKSGSTALPVSVYLGMNNYMGGFASSYFGVYIRMEGVEKAVVNKVASMRSLDVKAIQAVLSKVGVKSRVDTPLYLELTVVYHDYTLVHFAVDGQTLHRIPEYLKSFGSFWNDASSLSWERSVMTGGIFHQFPLEIGTPVSVTAGVTGLASVAFNQSAVADEKVETKLKAQFNLFGLSRIANHAPGLGTMHSTTSQRGLRVVLTRHFALGMDMRSTTLKVDFYPPPESDPLIAMAHGTSFTALQSDSPTRVRDHEALALLQSSCPRCPQQEVISKGAEYRKERNIPVEDPWFLLPSVDCEVKYFDCERDHSRSMVTKKIRKVFQDTAQNSGLFDAPLTKLFLTLSHARDLIFVAPHAETCGIYGRIYQNSSAAMKFERGEISLKLGLNLRDADGQENLTLSAVTSVTLRFGGVRAALTEYKATLEVNDRSIETLAIGVKVEVKDGLTQHHRVLCIKMDSSANRLPKDMLSYEGINEPNAEQRLKITLGKIAKGSTAPVQCLDNQATFDLLARSARSVEQKAEAASSNYPYAACQAEQSSTNYPGPFVPPSAACHAAAFEQTTLRQVNVTATYKVSDKVAKKIRPYASLLLGIGSFFSSVPQSADSARFDHSAHAHGQPQVEGQIDFDLNLRKDSATVDIHFHDITHNQEEHFHQVDLSLLPGFLRPKPVPSRMSPLWTLGFLTGAVGHCSVTPASVNTLDGLMYSAPLSDCWTLVSADCGPNAQFAVLGKKASPDKISILVHMGDSVVEFGPDLKPIIDGIQINKLEDKKIYVRENSSPLTFDVFRNGEEGYVVSKSFGVYVRYTGYFVTVTLGSRYREVNCGLCGHWDSSFYNDLVSPDNSCPALPHPDEMVKVYVVNEGTCKPTGNLCSTTVS